LTLEIDEPPPFQIKPRGKSNTANTSFLAIYRLSNSIKAFITTRVYTPKWTTKSPLYISSIMRFDGGDIGDAFSNFLDAYTPSACHTRPLSSTLIKWMMLVLN
jgi:hypothetical protein